MPRSGHAARRLWGATPPPDRKSGPVANSSPLFDCLARTDTAVALYQRALTLPTLRGLSYETLWYPFALRRLGELHESLGHRDRAIDYYSRFIDPWEDADPELQPQVETEKRSLARLVAERG